MYLTVLVHVSVFWLANIEILCEYSGTVVWNRSRLLPLTFFPKSWQNGMSLIVKCRGLTPFWGRAEVERALAVCNGAVLWGNCSTAHIMLCPADLNMLPENYRAVWSDTTNTLHSVVFWVMTPCIVVGEYRSLGGAVGLYLQELCSFKPVIPAYQDNRTLV